MKIKLFAFCVLWFFATKSIAQNQFVQVSPDYSGLDFMNILEEDGLLNYYTYGYLYNGGGVAAGDINNDGLQDLYFSGAQVGNKLYLNLGNLKFKDITDSAGVAGEDGFNTGITMVDINNDGFLDIYICKSIARTDSFRRNILYINNGDLTFTEQAEKYGLADESFSQQAYFFDMDKDGDLDMFLLNHPNNMQYANNIYLTYDDNKKLVADRDTQRQFVSYRYYERNNDFYTDKTMAAGLGSYAFGLSAIIDDFNSDGFPDIYVCNDFHEPDYLFINNKNKTFTEKGSDYFKHYSYSSMGSDYADINNDGFLDLMVADMIPEDFQRQKELKIKGNYDSFNKRVQYGFGHQYSKNVLQLNNGNNTYSDISYLSGVAFTDWSWAPLIADFDNDGFKDIYVTNGYYRDVTNMDFVMFNGDSIQKLLLKAKEANDVMKILSAIPSVKVSNYLFKNNGNLTFTNTSATNGINVPSWSNGAIYADLDNDGDLEIVVNNLFNMPFLFRNTTSDNKSTNFIRFKLKGAKGNLGAIGTEVSILTPDGRKQIQHFNPDKGYMSSSEWMVHFGIGSNDRVNAIVKWPSGVVDTLTNLAANSVNTLDISTGKSAMNISSKSTLLFEDNTKSTGVKYLHKENNYIDYKLEPLLPHQLSLMGPCIAVADVNGDKLDDFFVGGSKNNLSLIYLQNADGKFSLTKQASFVNDIQFEDVNAQFFDADKDGDNDLIVVSGGNEYPEKSDMYPVRLYLNNGKGEFTKSSNFPVINTSSKSIAIHDFDKDGDDDIFIGGRVVPGHYGLVPKSFLLQNSNGKFVDISSSVPSLSSIGMVTDAIWSDVNGDSFKDLVLVGEWMPVTIYYNLKGMFANEPISLPNSNGWWNTILPADVDGDGLMDLVCGNMSMNTRYKANEQFPMTMVVNDFDKNGSTDCVISLYQNGISYPIALRDNLLEQMNYLKKRFLRYKDYSKVTIDSMFSPEQLKESLKFKVDNIANVVFKNTGNGQFTQLYLTSKAQIFPITSILPTDYNKDGITDLLVAGNDYSLEVESGRADGGIGLALSGIGNGKFRVTPVEESGFYVPGDVKCMKYIVIGGKQCIIVGKNSDLIQFIECSFSK